MNCLSCYKENVDGYCLKCRKVLFGGGKVMPVLSFKAPQNDNIRQYQEHAKLLSISGAQLKYSLAQDGDELVLTEKSGGFILKPIPPEIRLAHAAAVPENEHLTMQIAAQVFKIDTAPNALVYFADHQPAYITKRFDVKTDSTKFLQEDFAQLSGKSKDTDGANYKYSGTYVSIGLLIRKYVAAYQPAMEEFFKVVFFNYLISNGDAHLKNFSLIQSDTGDYRLAPAYDLISTIIHVPGETDMALDLFDGDHKTAYYQTFGHHGYPDFREFANQMGLIPSRAKRIMTTMIAQKDSVIKMINISTLSNEIKVIYLKNFLDKLNRIKEERL